MATKIFKGEIKFINFNEKNAIVKESLVTNSRSAGSYVYNISAGTATAGVAGTAGTSTITYTTPITGGNASTVASGTYTIALSLNGAAAVTKNVTLTTNQTYTAIVSALAAALGVPATISSGNIVISSSTIGEYSSVSVTDGISNGLIAALNTSLSETATIVNVSGTNPTSGHQSLSSSTTAIVADRDSELSAGTYTIKINTVSYPFTITSETLWSGVISKMNTAIAAVATAQIIGNSIVITNITTGSSSTIAILDGTSNGFIAAVNAITNEIYATSPYGKLVMVYGDFAGYAKGNSITYSYVANSENNNLIFII